MTLPVPDVLDELQVAFERRYTIQREIGDGGMAVVYRRRPLPPGDQGGREAASPASAPPTDLEFHRQGIVVADDDGPPASFILDVLRLDGHRVTHVRDVEFAAVDPALPECHLFICGPGTGGMHAVRIISELRDNMPDMPVLCLATALRWTRRLEGLLPAGTTMLREPFTAERLRAAIRPLLPLTSGGTTLAWTTAGRPSGGVAAEETARDT